jgi:DNA-binding SARP family transcriptional activator
MGREPASRDGGDGRAPAELGLTGAFELSVSGRVVTVPHSAQRVIAFLALAGRPVSRARLAGTLWCESLEVRASKSLRTALWRLQRFGHGVVSTRDDHLALSPAVRVDFNEMTRLAHMLIRSPVPDEALIRLPMLLEGRELLPDWEEEWVVIDRERYRLLRLEALDTAAAELLGRHRLADALVVATAAVQSEPLRETARRIIVQVQLEQGNMAEALRCYRQYRRLLFQEYRLEPSPAMSQLVEPLIVRGR